METQSLQTRVEEGLPPTVNNTPNRGKGENRRVCVIIVFTMIGSFSIGIVIGFLAIPPITQISANPISNTNPDIATTVFPETTSQKQEKLTDEVLLMDVIKEENSVIGYIGSDDTPSSLHNHTHGFSLVRLQTDNSSERICLYLPLLRNNSLTRSLEFYNPSTLKLSAPLLITQPANLFVNPFQCWEAMGGRATMSMFVSEMCDLDSIYRVYPLEDKYYTKNMVYPYSATIDMTSLPSTEEKSGNPVSLKKLLSEIYETTPSVNVELKIKTTGYHVRNEN